MTPEEAPGGGDKENHRRPRGADEGDGSREGPGATHSHCVLALRANSEGKVGQEEVGQTQGNRKYWTHCRSDRSRTSREEGEPKERKGREEEGGGMQEGRWERGRKGREEEEGGGM